MPELKTKKASGLEDQLLKANYLTYKPLSDFNVVDRRSQIRHEFDQSSYTSGQTMQIRLGNGDSYIYGKNSYLRFDITTTTNNAGFGVGSVLNIFRDAELRSASGEEIDHVENINLYQHKHHAYTKGSDWFNSGKGSAMYQMELGNNAITAATTIQCCVPLSDILPVFDYDGLLPSLGFISGSTMKITLETAATALFWTTAAVEYTLTNIALVMDEFVLSDGIQKRLNEMSGSQGSGLTLSWNSWYHNHVISSAASVELQMANSVSKAVRAFGFIRDEANNVSTATADSIGSQGASAITEYQFKLGNLRLPDARNTRDTCAFVNTLIAFGKYDSDHQPIASREGFTRDPVDLTDPDANWEDVASSGTQCVATSFERSHLLQMSGYGVNADRLLRLSITKSAASERVDMFLVYTRYARIYLSRSVIKV